MLAGPATYLAVVFAVVLAVELILQAQGSAVAPVLGWIQLAIWAVFVCSSCSASRSVRIGSATCAATG